ncbi:hypothetical protein KR093_008697, partial [Drosophila rubida]
WKMEICNVLFKISATLQIILLILATPLILLVVGLTKICQFFIFKPKRSITGEVAVVTGAAHGLGRAIALELARNGCHIAAVDINIEGAEETVRQIREIYQVKVKAYKVNVTSLAEITDLEANVVRDLGPATILINNAGILLLANPQNPAPQDVQRIIDVNITSHFWTKSVFLPAMRRQRKGHIVAVSSLSSLFPLAYCAPYTATKCAVNGYMRALRMELAYEKQKDIHVTTVMPSFLDTNDQVADIVDSSEVKRLYPMIKGDEAARCIVEGMLVGEREIIIPFIGGILHRVF